MNEKMTTAQLRKELYDAMLKLRSGEMSVEEADKIADEAAKINKIKKTEFKELENTMKQEKKEQKMLAKESS